MNITLISPYPDITSLGTRIISATLKREGFMTQMIFLPNIAAETSKMSPYAYMYDNDVIDDLVGLCADSYIVGISAMTNYFEAAVQITQGIKAGTQIPVVWGGIHPTICPEECLEYADMVCIGEGEDAFLELTHKLIRGEKYHNVKNLWVKNNGQVIKNELRPLIQDLNSLPFPDYDLDSHYILAENAIRPMDEALLQRSLARATSSRYMGMVVYQTMTSRGCPHRCSYCCNDTLKGLYQGEKFVRRRCVDNIIAEMLQVKKRLPFVKAFWISDDSFFATTDSEIRKFSEVYKKKIGLPFFCLGSPTTINEKKMGYLIDAGLRCIQMGIQTGSKRICKEIYHRGFSNEQVLRIAKTLNKYKKNILPPLYDFILDNYYETEKDILETLDLLLKLPRPYRLQLFSLVLYPGTQLYMRAKRDGIIYDDQAQIYHKMYHERQCTYINLIFLLAKNMFPTYLLKILADERLVKLFNRKGLGKVFAFIFAFGRSVKRCLP